MKKKLVRVSQYIKIRSIKTVGLALFSSLILAPSLYAQISLDVQDQSIRHILKEIEKAGEYKFFYNSDLSNLDHKTSISVQDKNIDEVMSLLLANTEISYKKEANNMIVLTVKSSSSPQAPRKTRKITGTVVDPDGLPIIGANVIEQGTTNGSITDLDGKFELIITENAILNISYIGFSDKQITVKEETSLQVTMTEDTQKLDEIVVVGYGVQKKVNLTGSVSAVKGEELSQRPVANATQSLQGLVPGLTVSNSNSGRPGASGALSLRGQGNLANTANPYVLVDGVEMDLADVNPNDIESISVLKDAASAAIYGARAAYGVILVTTKKGEEGKMRISYQGTVGWSSPTVMPEMANAYDYATWLQSNGGTYNYLGNVPAYYKIEDTWKKPGDNAKLPQFAYGNTNIASSRWLMSTDHLRIKNITLGFTMPSKVSQKWGINKLRAFVSANNLLTWKSDGLYVDPETPVDGLCTFETPALRTITFGLEVGF